MLLCYCRVTQHYMGILGNPWACTAVFELAFYIQRKGEARR